MIVPHTDFCLAGEKANSKQVQFLSRALAPKDYRYFAYGGAIRGGKSYVVLFILHQLSLRFPKSKWIVVRESLPALKKTTIPSFKKLIDSKRFGVWNYSTPITFKYHNESEIIFVPESIQQDPDLTAFLGLECNGLFLEQLEELSSKMWDMAIQRTGSLYINPMPPAYIFTTFNPNQGFSKKLFYEPYIKGELKAPYFYMPALPKDNPHVTSDQWNNWNNMAGRYQDQFIKGSWSDFGDKNSLWAFAFERDKHISFPEYNPEEIVYLSFDFNKNPICCNIIQWYDDTIKVIEVLKLQNSDIYALCTQIKAKYPFATFMVTGDASGKNTSALVRDNLNYYTVIRSQLELTNQQFKIPSVNPRLEDNQVLVNSLLSHYKIEIHEERASPLIYDLGNVKMLPDGSIKKDNRQDESQQADALDGFRYFCNTFMNWFLRQ